MGDVEAKKHDKGLTLPTVRFAWFTGIAIILLFVFAMAVSPLLSTILSIVLLYLFSVSFLPDAACRRWMVIGTVVIIVLSMVTLFAYPLFTANYDAEIKQNTSAIQRTIERYATDFDSYPIVIDDLQQQGYLSHYPKNPYFQDKKRDFKATPQEASESEADAITHYQNVVTGEILTAEELSLWGCMRNVKLTDQRFVGDFTYIPELELDGSGNLVATGYTLLGYGLCRGAVRFQEHIYDGNPLEHVVYASTDAEFRQQEAE